MWCFQKKIIRHKRDEEFKTLTDIAGHVSGLPVTGIGMAG
jgi:hypothetical protein